MNLILFISLFIFLLASIEVAARKFSIKPDISRKIAHVCSAGLAALSPFFLDKPEIVFIAIIFAGFLLFSRQMKLLPSIHAVSRKTLGEVYMPLGFALSAIFFLPGDVAKFQFGVLVLGISDVLAALVGENMGKHHFKIFGTGKSVEGSLIFFLTTAALALLFFNVFDYRIFAVALALTIIESSMGDGLDNLVLPAASAYLSKLLFSSIG